MKYRSKLFKLLLAFILILSGCTVSDTSNSNSLIKPYGNYASYSNTYSNSWSLDSNIGKLDTSTAKGIRAKYTTIKGNNKDTITILVYMCGSNLESQSSMASYDLQEMANATIGSNINLIVFTGGTTKWHINQISTKYNQIYKVENGGITCLKENAGTGAMVDPATLTSFIEYGVKNYKANRYDLILWDHGGGSVSGFGSDEKYPRSGSMSLGGIDQALEDAGVQFDFIGFDACLMANTETALMLSEHADYLIGSEETEPGIGWYYTDWLTALSNNTSMPTIEIGKNIADSFVSKCKTNARGQSATLSVIDLAEAGSTLPTLLSAFASNMYDTLQDNYSTIQKARKNSKEFATEASYDLVDLVDLANNVSSNEAKNLINGVLSCVKYNNVSTDMANSYGLSIYFPYRNKKYASTVVNVYNQIDMNSEYSKCIQYFVNNQTTANVSSGGTNNPYNSISSNSSSGYYSSGSNYNDYYDLFSSFLGGSSAGYSQGSSQGQSQSSSNSSQYNPYADLYTYGLNLLFGKVLSEENRCMLNYVADHHLDVTLEWKDGKIAIPDNQWDYISELKLNLFIDDGEGYIDLGKDNVFEIDDDGNLLAVDEFTWVAISTDEENYQVVPYYYLYSVEDGDNLISYGYIPILYNGIYSKLMIMIDDEGFTVRGISFEDQENNTPVAKALQQVSAGDEIKFVCDYYDYEGNYDASYVLGDPLIVEEELYFGDVDISDYEIFATYEVVDQYYQSYWTTPM